MTSSDCTNCIDFNNVNIKSESLTNCMESMEWMKYAYDLIFEMVEPTDEQKLKILNNLIAKTVAIDELRKYYMNRACTFFNMRQWKKVLDDIKYIEEHGKLDGSMSILRIKTNIQWELEKARQNIKEKTDGYGFINYTERKELLETINQLDDIIQRTNTTNEPSVKNNLKRLRT